MLLFAKTHEWIKIDGKKGKVGISNHAQSELGDIVYIELPEVGDEFSAGDVLCEIESVKAVSEIYAPVDGKVVAVNEALEDSPELVNEDSMANWICELEIKGDTAGLLSEEEYKKTI
ncbi:MAG: glycine cleavage system protein GcvH [Christensenellales bacterium]|jgi:glycine cleavage system H protein